MKLLIKNNLYDVLTAFYKIKECYDSGAKNIKELFSDFLSYTDDYECIASEKIYELSSFKNQETILEEDRNGNPIENGDVMGECLIFFSEEMIEYYARMDELLKSNAITQKEYEKEIFFMENIIEGNICQSEYGSYSGIMCELNYGGDEEYEGNPFIKVYIDFWEGCYSMFYLYCGIILVFEVYKTKLKELNKMYYSIQKVQEAA